MIALAFAAAVLTMPPGWRAIPADNPPGGTVRMLAIAVGPALGGFAQNINVLRHQLPAPPASLEAWAKESVAELTSAPQTRVGASRAEKECNGTIDGWRIESTGVYSGRKLALVQTAVVVGTVEYVATYSRLEGTPPDAAALAALDTLCPDETGTAGA